VTAERARPRMDPPNVLWFFGAFAIAFGFYGLVDTIPNSQNGLWRLVLSIGFLVGFALASVVLMRMDWWVPGGLSAALAVATFPAVAVGFLRLVDVWPDDPFFRPFQDFNGYWLGVALATALVGLLGFALTAFPFILALVIAAILIASQLVTPGFDSPPTGEARAATALIAGALLVIGGVFLDAFGRRRDAFWFHVFGWLSAAAGLVFYTVDPSGDPNRGWVPMLVLGVLLVIAAGPIRRATWVVYGVLGYYAAIFHYMMKGLDEDRWPFALLALVVGFSIFLTGVLLHRYGEPFAGRFVRRPPPTLGP
jgi:hypothetical protein